MNKKIFFAFYIILFIIVLSSISVVQAVTEMFSVDKNNIILEKGDTTTVSITSAITLEEGQEYSITISNENIVDVTYNDKKLMSDDKIMIKGKDKIVISALETGESTITVSTQVQGETYQENIDVNVIEKQVKLFDIDNQNITINKGENEKFTITCDGKTDFGVYTLDNDIISISCDNAVFNNDKITIDKEQTFTIDALKEGKATIIVTIDYIELDPNKDGEFREIPIEKKINVEVVDNSNKKNVNNVGNSNNTNDIGNSNIVSINYPSRLPYAGFDRLTMIFVIVILIVLSFIILYKYHYYKKI